MRRIMSLFVVLVFAVSFVGNPVEAEAKPSLAQCKVEASKGTGWGTFWLVIGAIDLVAAAGLIATAGLIDESAKSKAGLFAGGVVYGAAGAGFMVLGKSMRSSANDYNKTCNHLLSGVSLEKGFKLEPVAQEATGMRMIYRW